MTKHCPILFEVAPGYHISIAADAMLKIARALGRAVRTDFNETTLEAQPDDPDVGAVTDRWDRARAIKKADR